MQEMLGHDGPPTNFWRDNLLSGEPLRECPLRTILKFQQTNPRLSREIDSHLRYYALYDRGVLLVAGGIADQPARYMELMEMIDRQKQDTESKHLELMRENAESEQHAAGGRE